MDVLNHDVPFTQAIVKKEAVAANLHSLMNARAKVRLSLPRDRSHTPGSLAK